MMDAQNVGPKYLEAYGRHMQRLVENIIFFSYE